MTDAHQNSALDRLRQPEDIREELSYRVREVKLLRQMLRLTERVNSQLPARQRGAGND